MTTGSSPAPARAYQINLAGWALFMLVFGGATATILQVWLDRQATVGTALARVVGTAVTPPAPIPPTATETPPDPTPATVGSATPSLPSATVAGATPAATTASSTSIAPPAVSAATPPARATPAPHTKPLTAAPVSRGDCLQACVDKCKDDANCERACAARCPR
jgi:hypothetical protein